MEQNIYEYSIPEEFPDLAIIKLAENVIGGSEALHFTNLIREVINKNVKYVIVDMINVKILNSSGLGMLVGSMSTLKKHNLEMIFINVPEKIYSILKMTHLNEIFRIFSNLNEAVANLKEF